MRSKLALFALTGIVLITTGSCNKEENYADLKVEKTEITLAKGDTTKVVIAQGSGSYHIVSADTTIVKPELTKNHEILLIGKAKGSTSVSVEDVFSKQHSQIAVKVNLTYVNASISRLIELFGMRSDRTISALSNGQEPSEVQKYSTLNHFLISFEGNNMNMEHEQIDSLNVVFKLTPVERVNNKEVFMKLLEAVSAEKEAKYHVSFIGKYDASGKLPNADYKKYVTKEQFVQALNDVDWQTDLLKTNFRFNDKTNLELQCDKGKLQIIVASLTVHDRWKWYFRFLGKSFEETLREQFFRVTSTGIIPPGRQLLMMKGTDRYSNNFKAVFIAPMDEPIKEIEMSYSDIEGNMDKIKETWFKMVDNNDREKNFGKFDRTIIIPKQGGGSPVILRSFEETKQWLNNNSPSSVASISPVFRSENDQVIMPSFIGERLIVVLTTIPAPSDAKQIVEILHR